MLILSAIMSTVTCWASSKQVIKVSASLQAVPRKQKMVKRSPSYSELLIHLKQNNLPQKSSNWNHSSSWKSESTVRKIQISSRTWGEKHSLKKERRVATFHFFPSHMQDHERKHQRCSFYTYLSPSVRYNDRKRFYGCLMVPAVVQ